MRSARTRSWATVFTAVGLAFSSSLISPSAQAGPCVTRSIQSILLDGGYVCELGDSVRYSFGTDMPELSGGTISFLDGPTMQTLSFTDLSMISDPVNPFIDFTYDVDVLIPPNEITGAAQTFTTSTPFTAITANSILPAPIPIYPFSSGKLRATFKAKGGNLTSLTQTIEKTPTPLSLLGAGAALGFSRKLRRRIRQAS